MVGEDHEEERFTSEDEFKILIATDIHVGYAANKKHRCNDSLNTFEEVLTKAIETDVDFVLLAGDLFHENNPTREVFMGVSRKLRQHCLSDRPVAFEFVSDPSRNFASSNFDRVNYEDPNLNVGMPVFSIHGNHDDLSGKGLSVQDSLHEVGLLNLFGKFETIDSFEVNPILLRKGKTNLALYGIGSQRDDRLCRAFQEEKIKFLRPKEESEQWFNILLLHQNRPRRSNLRTTGAYVPDKFIPSFFDLVIWGHEHECRIDPQYVEPGHGTSGDGFYIIQPGSTIATSLTADEAIPKHIAVLKVRGRKFKSTPVPLETVRQLLVAEINLELESEGERVPKLSVRTDRMPDEKIVRDKIESMIAEAERTRGFRQPLLPLIRLKVIYSGPWTQFPPLNAKRFGAAYVDRVANSDEMIQIKTIRTREQEEKTQHTSVPQAEQNCSTVDQIVSDYFSTCQEDEKLMVLSEEVMSRSMSEYSNENKKITEVDREFKTAVENQVLVFQRDLIETEEIEISDDYTLDLAEIEKRLMKKITVATVSRERARRAELHPMDEDDMEVL
uniref:Double-strand break repair protein n=1 Tax=Steinernema glaseri TaxID=37863 RepID=A0A1I8AWQ2_9BILA